MPSIDYKIILTLILLIAALFSSAQRSPAQAAMTPSPNNDDFANPRELGGNSGTINTTSIDATKQNGEPNHAGKPGGRSVWFDYTGHFDANLTIVVTSETFDTAVIAVYSGGDFAELIPIASNTHKAGDNNRRSVTVGVSANTQFRIAIDGAQGEGGDFSLNYFHTAMPANDNFANAEILDPAFAMEGDTTGGNFGGTKEAGEPDHAGNPGGNSIWYRWTAPADVLRSYTFAADRSTQSEDGGRLNSLLVAYTGNSVNTLTPVAASFNFGKTLIFTPTPGATYYIVVDGYNSSPGLEVGTIALKWGVTRSTKAADLDMDGMADVNIYRPITSSWYTVESSTGAVRIYHWGTGGDKPVFGRYAETESQTYGVFRPSTGTWHIRGFNGVMIVLFWGVSGDIPVPGYYRSHTQEQPTVFRPSNGTWYVLEGDFSHIIQFGMNGDIPVPADYDGDGYADIAVFRPSNGVWYIRRSSDGQVEYRQLGALGDKPVAADYDNDGRVDAAVYRPSSGAWLIQKTTDSSVLSINWGINTDIPQPADYDGDNRSDPAVYRPSNGNWYLLLSGGGQRVVHFGSNLDIPATTENPLQ